MMRNVSTIAAAIALSFVSALPSQANLPNPTMPSTGVRYWPTILFQAKAGVPLGYYELCMKGNPVCRLSAGRLAKTKSGAVILTDAVRLKIKSINTAVNTGMRFVNDGAKDVWSVAAAAVTAKISPLRRRVGFSRPDCRRARL